ncbi:hypothetical protein L2E82_02379 [Cichorium intybus]|uniref:Uncharacterized protein n=1 Tax=Cichorium intybus TaxID=13427 RepID=A0ACB9H147_CICIN|nr:hypothetical protein L1887_03862 [Cichorium endivia]KAI3789579.1 hypothetical protein L2E82_02379 [Cichorium intybus]
MDEPGDLLEDNWFFGNLLHTKPKTISRCHSDLTSSTYPPIHHLPPLRSNQEPIVKNSDRNNSSFPSRKHPPIAPRSLIRTPSLPNSIETQSFLMKNKNPSPNLMAFVDGSDQEDAIEPKGSSFSSRKQRPIAPPTLTRTPSLQNSIETQYFVAKAPSMSTSVGESDQEDEEEEDQESEFTLGRLIRQASMNSSHTSKPPRQKSKATIENLGKKPELDEEKIRDMRKMERHKSKSIKISGKNKNGGGAPVIPGGWVDKSSSEDMKAHIKFWARAVASNVRQECS